MRVPPEIGLFILTGIFLAIVGAYGTVDEPLSARVAFWILNVLGAGVLGMMLDTQLRGRIRDDWIRSLVTAVAITPAVALIVLGSMIGVLGHQHGDIIRLLLTLIWQVLIVALVLMLLRALLHRRPARVIEPRTIIMPHIPAAEAKFRARLSARGRAARLLAVEAHDHYLRVHTDVGTELISLRFVDAIDDLASVAGFRVHRSWWIAADAIKSARWQRSSGTVVLDTGLSVPVSRSGMPILRAAGWL